MTKKFIALLLALACVLSLAACVKQKETPDPAPTPGPDPAPTTITAEYTHGFVDMALELPEGCSVLVCRNLRVIGSAPVAV